MGKKEKKGLKTQAEAEDRHGSRVVGNTSCSGGSGNHHDNLNRPYDNIDSEMSDTNPNGGYIDPQTTCVYIKSMTEGILMKRANPFRVTEAIKNAIKGDVKSIKPIRSGDLLVETKDLQQVKDLCTINTIGQLAVKVVPAKPVNRVKGVIFAPSVMDMSEEELVCCMRQQGNKVSVAKFITKGPYSMKVKTPLIILTFETTTLPVDVQLGYNNVQVRPYFPSPLRCFKCNGYGHTAMRCRNDVKCVKCSENHKAEECTSERYKCSNCQTIGHGALDRRCPAYQQEKQIIEYKVLNNVTFYEARRRIERVAYAAVVKEQQEKTKTNVDTLTNTVTNISQTETTPKNTKDKEATTSGENNNNVSDKVSLAIVSQVIKIMNRNPGKATIQARQISQMLKGMSGNKIEVSTILKLFE